MESAVSDIYAGFSECEEKSGKFVDIPQSDFEPIFDRLKQRNNFGRENGLFEITMWGSCRTYLGLREDLRRQQSKGNSENLNDCLRKIETNSIKFGSKKSWIWIEKVEIEYPYLPEILLILSAIVILELWFRFGSWPGISKGQIVGFGALAGFAFLVYPLSILYSCLLLIYMIRFFLRKSKSKSKSETKEAF